ncbi:MAG: hypothetical protein ACFFBP_10070 [Promethearchaeota archaeon]
MSNNSEDAKVDFDENDINNGESNKDKEILSKDFIPHFLPTYRIKRNLYPIPIILVVVFAGILAFLSSPLIPANQGYIPGGDTNPIIGLLNGLIFTGTAVISAFVMIYFAKKKGIEVLKYIFGFSIGLLSFFLTWIFGTTILFLIIRDEFIYRIADLILIFFSGISAIIMLYRYFTSNSIFTKNFIVLYNGLLTGAIMGVVMPLWTTLAILIGISCWDIFAVLYKKGPIKEMIDLATEARSSEIKEIEEKEKIEKGEAVYDTTKLEIGIGDLVFYSMLTSSALIFSNNLIVMILTAIAIIIGTGITISGLKRNKILPGLPISIFLGIATMLISWGISHLLIIIFSS